MAVVDNAAQKQAITAYQDRRPHGSNGPSVAIVHDYLTQRGGAERVALLLCHTFPQAPLYTSLYDPSATYSGFADIDVRPLQVNRVRPLRHHHRLSLPVLAPSFSALTVEADVVICSSSGWAHGVHTPGRKVVYCYAPARWLYQHDRYLDGAGATGHRTVSGRSWEVAAQRALKSAMLAGFRRPLRAWDRRAAASAHQYVTTSSAMATMIKDTYGITAEVLPPPPALFPQGPVTPVPGVEPGFLLCVARLLPYKNVDVVIDAVSRLDGERLVVVGGGPDLARLQRMAPPRVTFVGSVRDSVLRWLYGHCHALVSASYEDYGLTPLEAAAFGRPSVVLRNGGFLDTVVEGRTGLFFDEPTPAQMSAALEDMSKIRWEPDVITDHARSFSADNFRRQIRAIAMHDTSLASA